MVDISVTLEAQGHYKNHKNKAKTMYLSLWLIRIFLGVNLGLGLNSFNLENHISNCKGVLGGVGINFILCLLLPFLLLLLLLLLLTFSFVREATTTPFFSFSTLASTSAPWEGSWVVRDCSRRGRGRAAGGGGTIVFSLRSSGYYTWSTLFRSDSARIPARSRAWLYVSAQYSLQTMVTSTVNLASVSNTPRS